MTKDKIKKILIPVLGVAAFGWTIYSILSYGNYYSGEPLTSLKVTLKDKPEFYFAGITKISFYHFTTNEYQNEFRIEEGGKDFIRDNKTFRSQLEGLETGDTISLSVRTSDIEKLSKKSRKIGVIGITVKNTLLLDPSVVKKLDREKKNDRSFLNYLFLIILIIFLVRTYIKSKNRK